MPVEPDVVLVAPDRRVPDVDVEPGDLAAEQVGRAVECRLDVPHAAGGNDPDGRRGRAERLQQQLDGGLVRGRLIAARVVR
jgi:hypothetical protein